MNTKDKWHIERLEAYPEDIDSTGVAYISKKSHGEAIRVYGNPVELTERCMTIIKALNGE